MLTFVGLLSSSEVSLCSGLVNALQTYTGRTKTKTTEGGRSVTDEKAALDFCLSSFGGGAEIYVSLIRILYIRLGTRIVKQNPRPTLNTIKNARQQIIITLYS